MSIQSRMSQLTDGIMDAANKPASAELPPPRRVTTAPAALAHFSADFNHLKVEVDRLKATQGLPATIPLVQLHYRPNQTRRIDEKKVAELMANLMANPLLTPVTARRISDGYYEVIGGRHRIEAYRRLGRLEIAVSVVELNDDEADRLVFYDNLLAPQLTDFEKYQGFSQLKKKRNISNDQLAMESGISKTLVTYLMSFERLPEPILNAIEAQPSTVGANLAIKLVALPASMTDRAVQAIGLISDERLTQANALAWIEQKDRPTKPEATTIKSGRQKFADVVRRENQISIKFTAVEDAAELEQEILEFLREKSKRQSGNA